ncbi:helix-turn-helix transcriptional regulator [Olivibacter sp. XZL3]|uniref:helix-turn-helix domain-containing protein n=1 Tax=Olivibacter sp. XZL3 TaxID=1735116 RepID=UPI001066B876|nr:helix-turn-helix transcriptional regulator [Olivibacter sp. XZL3]
MIAVLTGDIINSRKAKSPQEWNTLLRQSLTETAGDKANWEIFRGDSFQVELANPTLALKSALYIKACLKTVKGLDARIAIGIGKKSFAGERVVESYGDAYFFSGDQFELLKKHKQTLAIRTGNASFDEDFNLFFRLALTFIDSWTPNSAMLVKAVFENQGISQKELGAMLGIGQSSVSERFNRANLTEVLDLIELFMKRLKLL